MYLLSNFLIILSDAKDQYFKIHDRGKNLIVKKGNRELTSCPWSFNVQSMRSCKVYFVKNIR